MKTYTLTSEPGGYSVREYDPDKPGARVEFLQHNPQIEELAAVIYSWTQSGLLGDTEMPVPIGSTIAVDRSAVVVLFSAWPVLVAGSMPGDSELHRFAETS